MIDYTEDGKDPGSVPSQGTKILQAMRHGQKKKTKQKRDFPGGPVVETLHSTVGGRGSIPGRGTKIPHAARRGQKKKKKAMLF